MNNIYFTQFWRLESPGSRCQQIQCPAGTLFLIDSCLLTVSSHGRKNKLVLQGLFYKGINFNH